MHFTLMGFTALTGEPVMCIIILAWERENPVVETGVDFRQELYGDIEDADFFEKNLEIGKLLLEGQNVCLEGRRFHTLFIRALKAPLLQLSLLIF